MLSTTYTITGSVQTYTVPISVYQIRVDAAGAAGGKGENSGYTGPGGLGGYISTILNVVPQQIYYVFVGGAGPDSLYRTGDWDSGGYNGGGTMTSNGGSGGGASDLRSNSTDVSTRLVVAGGGGGG